MRLLLICIVLTLFTFKCYSQSTFITGVTIDSISHKKINNVAVEIYEKGKFKGRFLSNSEGLFKIPDSLFLSCTLLKINTEEYHQYIYKKAELKALKNGDSYLGEFRLSLKG